MTPDQVIEELKASGLRGRGGGGFPTGEKWAVIRRYGTGIRYVICNGAEGEPATPPGEEIGEEVHPDTDQVLAFVDGTGEADLDGQSSEIGPNDPVFVHAGTRHNVRNTGEGPLRVITIYAPPEHPPGTIHETKAEADAAEE